MKQLQQGPDTYVKYLGISIDKVLSWNKQIDILWSKVDSANAILSKLSFCTNKNFSLTILFFQFTLVAQLPRLVLNKRNKYQLG